VFCGAERLTEVFERRIFGEELCELACFGASQGDGAAACERPVEDESEFVAAGGDRGGGPCGRLEPFGVFAPQSDYLASYVESDHRRSVDTAARCECPSIG
jgi:hypothetical protein